jgi:hypothetical protein
MTECEKKGCNKPGQTTAICTKGKRYCSLKHLKEDGAKQSEERKEKTISFKLWSLLLLLVSLLLTQLHYFFYRSFLYIQQKLKSAKRNAINNPKLSAAKSAALLVTKQDITARHIAGGARVDTNLTHNEVRSVAQGVVNQVLATVPTGSMAYVAAGRDYRIQIEVWGFSKHGTPSLRQEGQE